MSNDILARQFAFEGMPIRVTTDSQGDPWFAAPDVTSVLGYTHSPSAIRRLDSDEYRQVPAFSLVNSSVRSGYGQVAGSQMVTVVSESGMYNLILGSEKPEAKRFQRWVTHDVLPAIRRHGGYLTPEKIEEALLDPDTVIRLATKLKAERARRQELEAQSVADAPKVLFADAVATSKTSILVGELAKILKANGFDIGQNRLFTLLRDEGYLIRREGTDYNMPTQKAMDLGLFEIKETAVTHADGHVTVQKTPKVTGKGQQYFISRYLKQVTR